MKSIKALKTAILISLTAAILTLTGCATKPQIVMYPMAQTDIFSMEPGTAYTPVKHGWFVSDFWMDKVGKVKVETVTK